MKYRRIVFAASMLVASAAHAQSSVTLFGLIVSANFRPPSF